jgi:hypothetical protein
MQEQMDRLARDLSDTKAKLVFAGSMEYEAPYYFNVADGKRDGPYCATCWDGRDRLAVRLYEWSPGSWICNTCKAAVHGANYRDPLP